jgi:hypothetical protein
VFNGGAQPGQILDFRLVFASDDLTWATNPEYTVDPEKWRDFMTKPGKINNPGDIYSQTHKAAWSGLLIRKEETVTEQIVFASNMLGFRTIPQGIFRAVLEYCTPFSGEWRRIREFELNLDDWVKRKMESGDSFSLGATTGDRRWSEQWQDTKNVIVDKDVERQLGIPEAPKERPRAQPGGTWKLT